MGFLEEGFEKVSLNELIKRTGLTKGAFYYHFKSKEELLREIMHKYFHAYINDDINRFKSFQGNVFDKIELVLDFITDIKQRINSLSTLQIEAKAFFVLYQDGLKRDKKLREHHLISQGKILTYIASLIEEGQNEGSIRQDISAEAIAKLLNSCIRGSMIIWTFKHKLLRQLRKANFYSPVLPGISAQRIP